MPFGVRRNSSWDLRLPKKTPPKTKKTRISYCSWPCTETMHWLHFTGYTQTRSESDNPEWLLQWLSPWKALKEKTSLFFSCVYLFWFCFPSLRNRSTVNILCFCVAVCTACRNFCFSFKKDDHHHRASLTRIHAYTHHFFLSLSSVYICGYTMFAFRIIIRGNKQRNGLLLLIIVVYGSPKGTLGEKKVVKIAISFPRNNISFERIILFERIIISFRTNYYFVRTNYYFVRTKCKYVFSFTYVNENYHKDQWQWLCNK